MVFKTAIINVIIQLYKIDFSSFIDMKANIGVALMRREQKPIHALFEFFFQQSIGKSSHCAPRHV